MCWPEISGYAAACWRALARRREDVELSIIAFRANTDIASFDDQLVEGLPCQLVNQKESQDAELIAGMVARQRPQVVNLPGWFLPGYNRLPFRRELAGVRFVMGMDTPRRYNWRQNFNRFYLRRFLRRIDRVIVPGERAWQYARYLGFDETQIHRGAYGVDWDLLSPGHARRVARPEGWPRRFLFVGRYAAVKGVDVLMEGYADYRSRMSGKDPWELGCCGQGPMASLLENRSGVKNLGFVQPLKLPEIQAEHGVFVLPSRYDPWPLAIVEACAAGMPVIASQACGSGVELLRPYDNGLLCATGDKRSLADAMCWMHEHYSDLPRMGSRSQALAAAYTATLWAQRWVGMVQEMFAGDRA